MGFLKSEYIDDVMYSYKIDHITDSGGDKNGT